MGVEAAPALPASSVSMNSRHGRGSGFPHLRFAGAGPAIGDVSRIERCSSEVSWVTMAMWARRLSWVTPAMSWPSIRMRPASIS